MQSQGGRRVSRRAANESADARAREARQNRRERQLLDRRIAGLHRHANEARARLIRQQKVERNRGTGSVLQRFEQDCAPCHTSPDGSKATDRAWLERVPVTSCSGMVRDARAELARYLGSVEGLQPRTHATGTAPGRDQGEVVSNLPAGEIFLRDSGGVDFRLVWAPGQAGEGRALPAGTYRVLGHRVVDGSWTASATGGRREVVAGPGGIVRLPIDTGLVTEIQHQLRSRQLTVTLSMRGQDGMGVGLFHGGVPIQIPVVVVQDGGVVAQGTLRSIGTGLSRATLAVPELLGEGARVRVDLPAAIPFEVRGPASLEL